ncbi:hypothetical protein HZH66_001609 [Vespula vulgaris]|uniref:Uncharacterized protein n=1 Tax=Vespula vulgaris TaxID=7454 RepID=A0A834NLS4_VESVU|nr:hypothetical protein HZH66_001609 [Vespula vulgaris]
MSRSNNTGNNGCSEIVSRSRQSRTCTFSRRAVIGESEEKVKFHPPPFQSTLRYYAARGNEVATRCFQGVENGSEIDTLSHVEFSAEGRGVEKPDQVGR